MELTERSALDQAALIRAGELGCAELLEVYLARIEALNPRLNAFTQVVDGLARRRARKLDAGGVPDDAPLFHGVPSGVKDSDPMRCTFTRVGSRAYRYLWTPFDSPVVRRLRAGGFVLTGKTATSELTLLPVVETDLQPPTVNPYNPEHTAGGSSGGAAAAVASGMLPIAHATDGAGSIRIPAAFCHLFGFKHSRGFLPNFYEQFEPLGMAATGAVAFTVQECCAVLDVYAKRVAQPAAADSLLARCRLEPPQGLRVRVGTETPLLEIDAQIAARLAEVAATLEGLGHRVEPGGMLAVELDEFLPVFQHMAAIPPVLFESSLQPETRWLREPGKRVSRGQAVQLKNELSDRVLAWFGDADIWLLPTVGCLPPKAGAWTALPPEETFAAAAKLGAFTAGFNVSGQPAASVPAGLSAEGLPIGVQLVGKRGADELVLQLARQLEEALGCHSLRAPLFKAGAPG